MLLLLTHFNFLLAHPDESLHRLPFLSGSVLLIVGYILLDGGIVAVADGFFGRVRCFGEGHADDNFK
jgi:hypothetical protein